MSILEAAYDNEQVPYYNAFLKNASFVYKGWTFIAQRLLFRNINLSTQTAYVAFQHSIHRATPRGCMLGDAIVRMKVVLDQNQPYRLFRQRFARAVSLCHNLCELCVAVYGEGALGLHIVGAPDASRMKRTVPAFDQ